MISAAGASVSALSAFATGQAVTANNVANINSTDFKASSVIMQENKSGGVSAVVLKGGDSVEISREAVDMIITKNAFKANVAVLKTSEEMSKELLNIKA